MIRSFVTVFKISPNPSLSKRGINPPFKKGAGLPLLLSIATGSRGIL
jgi:hypothetical protein